MGLTGRCRVERVIAEGGAVGAGLTGRCRVERVGEEGGACTRDRCR